MFADMSEWCAFDEAYVASFEPDLLLARSAFSANGLALGARGQIELNARFAQSGQNFF